jgi:alpha-L-arabinofuranosidase
MPQKTPPDDQQHPIDSLLDSIGAHGRPRKGKRKVGIILDPHEVWLHYRELDQSAVSDLLRVNPHTQLSPSNRWIFTKEETIKVRVLSDPNMVPVHVRENELFEEAKKIKICLWPIFWYGYTWIDTVKGTRVRKDFKNPVCRGRGWC